MVQGPLPLLPSGLWMADGIAWWALDGCCHFPVARGILKGAVMHGLLCMACTTDDTPCDDTRGVVRP